MQKHGTIAAGVWLDHDNRIAYFNVFSSGPPASHNTKNGFSLMVNLGSSTKGCFYHVRSLFIWNFIMDEERICRRVLFKFLSSAFDLEVWLASAGLLRYASFYCPPQPVAVFAVNVFAGNPEFTCNPELAGSLFICFLKT